MEQKLLNYQPFNEQEEKDKELLLKVIEQKDVLTRKNTIGHFTVSCWVLNQSHDKVLMCYHKIYNSWCWLGGHVDGQKDFKKVALKEFQEESGLKHVRFLKDDPFSIEVLTVNGHIKNGVYVSSHLHYNITYLMEADDQERLIIKEDENNGVLYTGDIGYLEDGLLYIEGRKNREVKINGRRIRLEHLEENWKKYFRSNMVCSFDDSKLYLLVEGKVSEENVKKLREWIPILEKDIIAREVDKLPRKANGKVNVAFRA